MPGGEAREHLPYAERDRVHADRGARDAANFFPHAQRIARALTPELPAPRLVGHLAAVRLAVHKDVHVLETVRRIDGHEERDGLVFAEYVPDGGEAYERVGARHPQHSDR